MRPRRVCAEKEALEFIASGTDKDIFQKKVISQEKGYGVIACKDIEPGEFLLEYAGRHITGSEGEALFKEYSAEDAAFLYFYSYQGHLYCVDGSKDTERLGRFINDDHIKPNSKIKIICDGEKRPHLCAFATTKIPAGEEIVFDYGDPDCPWRHEIANMDNSLPQQHNEIDISENVCDDVTESSLSNNEEECSKCEMNNMDQQLSLFVEMLEEEEEGEKEEGEEEEEEEKEDNDEEEVSETKEVQGKIEAQKAIRGKPLKKTMTEMDESANDCQNQHMIKVKTSSNKPCQRIYDKKNVCLYCEKPYAKITRHLKQKHHGEVEVAKALSHKQGSSMRNLLLTKVRNLGNFHHNSAVLSTGKGEIIPKRQALNVSVATDYLPCKFCFGMYVKTDLWRHHKRCKLQKKENILVRRKVQASCSLLLPMDSTISAGLQKIIGDMTYDAVTQVVKSDTLILSLGERMFLKNGEVGRYRADIRNKMRELARLLLVARSIDKDIVTLKDLINPAKFNTVLEAVKKMTGFDGSTNRFSVPSTALKLRHSLIKVAQILQGEALRHEDEALKGRAEHFNKLIELEWTIHVSSNALKTLYQKKWNSAQILPLAEDIRKLQKHLKYLEEVNKQELNDHPSKSSWSDLSQVTLSQLILFNRRREGEVSRMEVKTYLQRNHINIQDDILESLSPFEKKLCENLTRIEIRGKRGRKVPILLPANVKESVELLIKTREDAGISQANPYIFARPNYGSLENMRGCDSLKRYAKSCGAKHPENITSTKLRKHVATVSQLLNLKTHELDQLATFMGHDIYVHREFYRLPEETLQMAKVSRILFALQSGISKYKGQSLEDITPNINSEEGSSSDSEDGNSKKQTSRGENADKEKDLSEIRDLDSGKAAASHEENPKSPGQKQRGKS
ncbi:uncharacterized protein isoform X2 [Danio rerio]|uniref:Uncharacterized protein isoform X2 n=2 Tax=Danio rerio TaxID=7955 RepID=A0AC58HGV5_DANRE